MFLELIPYTPPMGAEEAAEYLAGLARRGGEHEGLLEARVGGVALPVRYRARAGKARVFDGEHLVRQLKLRVHHYVFSATTVDDSLHSIRLTVPLDTPWGLVKLYAAASSLYTLVAGRLLSERCTRPRIVFVYGFEAAPAVVLDQCTGHYLVRTNRAEAVYECHVYGPVLEYPEQGVVVRLCRRGCFEAVRGDGWAVAVCPFEDRYVPMVYVWKGETIPPTATLTPSGGIDDVDTEAVLVYAAGLTWGETNKAMATAMALADMLS